jgi:hypothetical protein
MKEFKDFLFDVDKGIEGKNLGIPTGFPILDSITNGIQKSIYTLVGGNSGVGKTSFVDLAYVLNPYDWLMKNKDKTDFKLKIIYNSMERNTKYKLAKWTCFKLFKDYGIIIDVPTILQWQGAKRKISEEDRKLIYDCEKYFDEMSDVVTIYQGAENPTGIMKRCQEVLKNNGKIDESVKFHSKYIPDDENLIILVINDHVGKLKNEKNYDKKELLDKHSEYSGFLRDFYGVSSVNISQFNRSIGNIERYKNKDVSPEPDDFKGSGNLYEDADVALGLFNPYKFKIYDFLDYDIRKFISPNGENRFRSVSVVKNSYGPDDIIIGLNFLGENGYFREIPVAEEFKKNPSYYVKATKFLK